MIQDLRYSLRILRQSPSVAILSILAIAIGIGANAAIFSVVNGVLLRPLPYKDPEQLVFLRADLQGETGIAGVAGAEIRDIREQSRLIEQIGWMVPNWASLTGDEQMELLFSGTASDEFLPVLGIQPEFGRGLRAKEDLGAVHKENLLISHELWERRYHRDPNIIGRRIEVNNFTVRIVGVMPEGFRLYMGSDTNVPPRIDIWFPAEESGPGRRYHYYKALARLRKGVSLDQAQAEMDAITARMIQGNPAAYPDGKFRLRLVSLQQDLVKPARPAILVLLAAVGFVLLIACANVANLLLARAAGREKEIAIRAALGAGRMRVIRQLLTESVVVGLLGGAAGLMLAQYGVDLLLYLRPENLPRREDIVLDGAVTAFAFGLSVICGILFGLAPAFHAAKTDINDALKQSGRSSTSGPGRERVRTALVVAQVALALVLLIGAGLMIRTFANLSRVDLGFDPANLLTFKMDVSQRLFPGYEKRWQFYKRGLEAVRSQPGVESASGAGRVPLDPLGLLGDIALEESRQQKLQAVLNPVLPGYFETMRIPLIAGRGFTEKDNDDGAAVAILDDRFARRTWPGESAVGKRIYVPEQPPRRGPVEIIGIVRHIPYGGLRGDDRPQIYIPYRNDPVVVTWVVRTKADPLSLAAPLRKVVEGQGGRRPVFAIRPMIDYVSDAMAETRFALVLLGLLSLVAFVLSVVGVYGVVAYTVAERMPEFAIRIALGAQSRDILRLAFGWGVAPAAAGIAIGIAASLGLTRFLSGLLFGVGATDPATYIGISALLFSAVLLATVAPVRGCIRIDPRTFLQ